MNVVGSPTMRSADLRAHVEFDGNFVGKAVLFETSYARVPRAELRRAADRARRSL